MKIIFFLLSSVLIAFSSKAQIGEDEDFLEEIIDSFRSQNNNRLAFISTDSFTYSLSKESGLHRVLNCPKSKNIIISNGAYAYCAAHPAFCKKQRAFRTENFNSPSIRKFRDSLDVLETRYSISNSDSDDAKLQAIYSSERYKQFAIREIQETPILLLIGTSNSVKNKGFKYFWVDFFHDQNLHPDNGNRLLVIFKKTRRKWHIQKIKQYYN